jgi:hypothetical protein
MDRRVRSKIPTGVTEDSDSSLPLSVEVKNTRISTPPLPLYGVVLN